MGKPVEQCTGESLGTEHAGSRSLAVHMMDNASALPTCAQHAHMRTATTTAKAAADQNRLEITHSIAR